MHSLRRSSASVKNKEGFGNRIWLRAVDSARRRHALALHPISCCHPLFLQSATHSSTHTTLLLLLLDYVHES